MNKQKTIKEKVEKLKKRLGSNCTKAQQKEIKKKIEKIQRKK